jgi:hypothetical protein
MKKLILFLLFFICISVSGFAQKPDLKPTFKVDTGKVILMNLKFSLQQYSDFLYYLQNPNELQNSKTMSVYDATQIKLHSQLIATYMINEFSKSIREDKEKFTTDTLAKYHPQKK